MYNCTRTHGVHIICLWRNVQKATETYVWCTSCSCQAFTKLAS